jgi:hypothetical protein
MCGSITDRLMHPKITPGEKDGSGSREGGGERQSRFFNTLNVFSHREKRKKSTAISSHKMLTSCQLSDLFRRLDKNGNGELELSEFLLIIKKLKIAVDEDFVNRYVPIRMSVSVLTLQSFSRS